MWLIRFFVFTASLHQMTILVLSFSIKTQWIKDLLPSSSAIKFDKNGTLHIESPIFSCLEDEGSYEAVNNYLNCHLFCPSCGEGFGKCVSAQDLKVCVCECQYPVQLHRECSSIQRYCRTEVESDSDNVMKRCKEACETQGFSDGALCGLEGPPFRSTCTCLCPTISL